MNKQPEDIKDLYRVHFRVVNDLEPENYVRRCRAGSAVEAVNQTIKHVALCNDQIDVICQIDLELINGIFIDIANTSRNELNN